MPVRAASMRAHIRIDTHGRDYGRVHDHGHVYVYVYVHTTRETIGIRRDVP